MLTCREMIDFLMDYLDGHLPPEQCQAFREHLQICPPCVDFMESYKTTVSVGKKTLCNCDDEIPASVPDALIRAILAARQTKPPEVV